MRINKVFLTGRLGSDPSLRQTSADNSMLVSRLATNYGDNTEWYTLLAFSKTAEYLTKFAQKGQEVFIEGRLSSKIYNDKTGKEREGTVVIVLNVLLGKIPLNIKPLEQEDSNYQEQVSSSMFEPS